MKSPGSQSYSSIKQFTQDGEFIEFLKNVCIFCTQEETPRECDNMLFQNLSYLRQKFKEYKNNKDKKSSYSHEQTNLKIMESHKSIEVSNEDKSPYLRKQRQTEFASINQTPKSPYPQFDQKPPTQKNSFIIQESPKSTLSQLPEKQRKQIEFIDDFYEKLVAKKQTIKPAVRKHEKKSSMIINEDKENQFKPQRNVIYNYYDNSNEKLNSTKRLSVTDYKDVSSRSESPVNINTKNESATNPVSFGASASSLPNAQPNEMHETLKTLSITAQQLREACMGINSFTQNFQKQFTGMNLTQGSTQQMSQGACGSQRLKSNMASLDYSQMMRAQEAESSCYNYPSDRKSTTLTETPRESQYTHIPYQRDESHRIFENSYYMEGIQTSQPSKRLSAQRERHNENRRQYM